MLFQPNPSCASAHDSDRWIAPPATAELFNNLPQGDLGTGRRSSCTCGCSSAGRARPRHGRGHEFESRHPLHFGCAHALRCRATWCWRPGCARSWPGLVQRDTASDGTLARGHSRSGFLAPVAQQAERPPCKRQVARSIRRRGLQTHRVRPAGRRRRTFTPETRVRIPHAVPDQRRALARGQKSAVKIGRRRNPYPDQSGGVAQWVEQPFCTRQAAGSKPVTSTTMPR